MEHAIKSRTDDVVDFKQKTAYEIVSRDWSSDVCSSDLEYSCLLICNGYFFIFSSAPTPHHATFSRSVFPDVYKRQFIESSCVFPIYCAKVYLTLTPLPFRTRSEERRVGKE